MDDVPAEEAPLPAQRRSALQRQESGVSGASVPVSPPKPKRGGLFNVLRRAPRSERSDRSERSGSKSRKERRAERWEKHKNFERIRFDQASEADPSHYSPERKAVTSEDALGSAAFAEHMRIQRLLNSGQLAQRSRSSPIAKVQKAAVEDTVFEENAEKAVNLEHWLDGGLKFGAALKPKRMFPTGYELAPWSEEVPFLRHARTGVVLWPMRLDLMPFFVALEGQMAYRKLVTAYHYTTGAGFNRIVARFETESGEMPDSQDFAEEVWDRLVEDVEDQDSEWLDGLDVPDDAFVAISHPPDKFPDRETLCRAVCHLPESQGRLPLGRVSYCIAVRVPEDRLLAAGRQWPSTVFVAAPGSVDELMSQDTENSGSKLQWLSEARMKEVTSKKEPNKDKLLEEVKVLGLLDGLVDRETGQVIQDSPKTKEQVQRDALEEEFEHAKRLAEEKVSNLISLKRRCERKLLKAQAPDGEVDFFNGPERIRKLQQHLERISKELQEAEQELQNFDDQVARSNRRQALLNGEVSGPSGPKLQLRRRQAKFSEFAGDTLESVGDLGDEYKDLQGHVLRDMLGGSNATAKAWLEQKGDPNIYDGGTGWTPVLMCASSGNLELLSLLISFRANLALPAKASGESAVHLAVYKTSSEVLHKLLDTHRNAVHEVRKDGSSALMVAVECAPPKVKNEFLRALLDKTADPNLKRKDGWTPLGVAIRNNMRFAAKIMVARNGAILTNVPGTTPPVTLWELAAQHKDLQQALRLKLSSKDLAEIEKRWPGTLLQMQVEEE